MWQGTPVTGGRQRQGGQGLRAAVAVRGECVLGAMDDALRTE